MANATVLVMDVGGRQTLSIDRNHRLVARNAAGVELIIESRPVTEFAGAVDYEGRLHVAALLLSRQLMFYTTADGRAYTRSALLKGDSTLRLREPQLWAGRDIYVAYVAETERADTLVCYRRTADDWEGKRLAEVMRPQRLTALQFDGSPGAVELIYSVKDNLRCTISSIAVEDGSGETIATMMGGCGDFCAMTSGGARHACWLTDGYLMIDGVRQPGEPWTCSFPLLRREEGGLQCLWLEGGQVHGVLLGDRRATLRPQAAADPFPCKLAQPGELRRAILAGPELREVLLPREGAEPEAAARAGRRPQPGYRREGERELTLTDVVHNQAVVITRMQESLSAMERSVLRQQAEINRLSREVAAALRAREPERAAPAPAREARPQRAEPRQPPEPEQRPPEETAAPAGPADAGAAPEPSEKPEGAE